MNRLLLAACALLIAAPFSPEAQVTPAPEQIERALDAIQSGELQLTPDLIDRARQEYPELRDVPDSEIRSRAEELRQNTPEDAAGRRQQAEDLAGELEDFTDEMEEFPAENGEEVAENGEANEELTRQEGETESEFLSRRESDVRGQGVGPGGRFPFGSRRFGADFFNNAQLGEGLGPNAPTLPEYVLSAGDQIELYIWGRESRSLTVTLDKDGMFKFLPLEPFRVAGMTFLEAQELITNEIEKIAGLRVSVGLGRVQSIRVMVVGEATRPGSYVLPGGITVTGALFRSGGVSSIGSMRNIEVRRGNEIAVRFDLYDILLKGDVSGDIQLLPGDVIFVPIAKKQVAVQGTVKRPAIYEVPNNFRALDAVELAGGLASTAHKGRIRLDRIEGNKRKVVLDVDMEKVTPRTNAVLEDGDILFVDRVLDRLEQVVYLTGNVNRPGRYQYTPGMTVRDLIKSRDDLRPETFFEYGHIRRPSPEDDRPTLLNFSLRDVLDGSARVQLQPRDEVVIYNRYQVLERPSVRITGSVRNGGEFLYKEGMQISDLVILAGGLTDAYLPETHLRRAVYDAERDTTFVRLIRINLREVLENPKSEANLRVNPFDSYTIFSRSQFEPSNPVSIAGPVRRTGTFSLADSMRITDLIVQAGGLAEAAHTLEAHLRRRVYDTERDTTYTELTRVNLRRALETPGGEHDLVLRPHDALRVFSRRLFEPSRSVAITGAVANPGRYSMVEQMRVSDLIVLAGGLRDAHLLEAHLTRRVPVPERDSSYLTLVRVNLKEAIEDPESWENITLRPFDSLRVLPRSQFQFGRSVTIRGSVRSPGDYKLVEEMDIPALINIAGGLTKSSFKLEIEVVRRNIVADSVMTRTLKRLRLVDILEGKEGFALQDGDGIYIRDIVQYRERTTVTLQGEFNFPGVYEFVPGETISSVIKRAGGFTPEAYVRGTVFLRQSVRDQQLRHAEEVGRRVESQLQAALLQATRDADRTLISAAIQRNSFIVSEIAQAPHLGRVIVRVDKDLRFAGSDWDIPLEEGDVIQVGPRVSTVSILGEVYSPTTVIHTRSTNTVGKSLNRAGGVNNYGDYKNTYYVDPDGTISTPRTTAWFMSFRAKRVHPGGSVIVPLKPPPKDYLEAWVRGTQVLYQLAITVGVARNLF